MFCRCMHAYTYVCIPADMYALATYCLRQGADIHWSLCFVSTPGTKRSPNIHKMYSCDYACMRLPLLFTLRARIAITSSSNYNNIMYLHNKYKEIPNIIVVYGYCLNFIIFLTCIL